MQIIDILRGIADSGRTVVMVTHGMEAAAKCDRRIRWQAFWRSISALPSTRGVFYSRGDLAHVSTQEIYVLTGKGRDRIAA